MRNRSLQERRRTSAGIMSPAARCTTSPGTNFASGISLGCAIPEDGRIHADHGLELGGGGVGPGFLDKPQHHAQDHHDRHHRRRPYIAGNGRYDCQNRQQDYQRIYQGPAQQPQRLCRLSWATDIRTKLL